MSLGTAAAPAFERLEENKQIARSSDPAPKIARLAETLNITEAEIRSSSLPEGRLAAMFNEYASAFKNGIHMLTAATLMMLPAILGGNYLYAHGSKAAGIALGVTEALLTAASIAYPQTIYHRIKDEIKSAAPAPGAG